MAFSHVIKGAEVKVYISGKLYESAQSVQYTIDYGEQEIYGIDSPYPQEIAHTRMQVQGSVSGIRIKLTGGLQGYNARPLINQILYNPYISFELRDRQTDTKLLWVPQIKVTSENFSVSAKGVVKINFSFKGIIPYNELDLNG